MIKLSSYFSSIQSRKRQGSLEIFCLVRKKWLIAQPEEYVRQAAILHLSELGYSINLISVEKEIEVHSSKRRYDIVVWNHDIKPVILVECKAPEISLGGKEMIQAGMYNLIVHAGCVWITNGHKHHISLHNRQTDTIEIVDSLPLPSGKEGKMSLNPQAISFGESWSYDHFIGFLLLYAAYADYDYSADEEQYILSLISPDILEEVEREFNKMGEFEQLQTILGLKGRFLPNEEDKVLALKALSDLFNSDGDFSKLETNLYDFLERLL